MAKQHVLVTGGAGFIGSHLTDELLSRNFQVTVIDNLKNGLLENLKDAFKSKKFAFVKGDILKPNDIEKSLRSIDIVFHLACLGVRHSIHSPFENHKVNAEGSLTMLEAARQHKIKKFYYISSSEIYGGVKKFPIDETATPKPFTVYGASKLAGENYAYAFYKCYGLDTTILRIFNNYGPRAHFEGDAGELIPRAIIHAIYNKPPIIFGNGEITRDFFYVKDTARALANLIDIPNLKGEIMNIGAGKEIKIIDIVKKILIFIGRKKLKVVKMRSRPADVPRLWVNADKFYRLTDFQPSFSLDKGLKETIKYYLDLSKKSNLLSKINIKNWEK